MANQTKAERPETAAKSAKILLYDTETSPNIIAAWGVFEQDALEVIKPRQIIVFSWKWLGDKGSPQVLALPSFPGYGRDKDCNRELIKRLHGLFEQADIVVGHNARKFDDKRANTDFIKHGLPPPPPHKVVDTLEVARKYFGFNRNSLKALAEELKCGAKLETGGYSLWKRCADGDMSAWRKMMKYCQGDVSVLEKIYIKLRPWMNNHPALKVREDGNRNPPCPMCHKRRLQSRGAHITRKGRTPRVQCGSCGHWPPVAWISKAWRVK